jgi:hypothetical protein
VLVAALSSGLTVCYRGVCHDNAGMFAQDGWTVYMEQVCFAPEAVNFHLDLVQVMHYSSHNSNIKQFVAYFDFL